MRYDEIVDEDIDIFSDAKIKKILVAIKEQCSEIINVIGNTDIFLYRGINSSLDFISGKSKENRPPTDTLPEIQKIIDEWLSKHNFKALRSNSYFTTTDLNNAEKYGNVYYIFPLNGNHYTWFNYSDDLYLNLPTLYNSIYQFIFEDEEDYENYKDDLKEIFTSKQIDYIREKNKIEDYDFIALYESGMFKHIIDDSINYFMEIMSPSDENLEYAFDRDNEIMFSGKYYAISKKYLESYDIDEKKLLEILKK